jgi:hypothetical protein
MPISRGLRAVGLGTAMAGALVFAAPGVAAAQPADNAAELCRQLDEQGELEFLGVTRGECVNLVKGPASPRANNFIAAICGIDFVQQFTGTTNKGQCIQAFRS